MGWAASQHSFSSSWEWPPLVSHTRQNFAECCKGEQAEHFVMQHVVLLVRLPGEVPVGTRDGRGSLPAERLTLYFHEPRVQLEEAERSLSFSPCRAAPTGLPSAPAPSFRHQQRTPRTNLHIHMIANDPRLRRQLGGRQRQLPERRRHGAERGQPALRRAPPLLLRHPHQHLLPTHLRPQHHGRRAPHRPLPPHGRRPGWEADPAQPGRAARRAGQGERASGRPPGQRGPRDGGPPHVHPLAGDGARRSAAAVRPRAVLRSSGSGGRGWSGFPFGATRGMRALQGIAAGRGGQRKERVSARCCRRRRLLLLRGLTRGNLRAVLWGECWSIAALFSCSPLGSGNALVCAYLSWFFCWSIGMRERVGHILMKWGMFCFQSSLHLIFHS